MRGLAPGVELEVAGRAGADDGGDVAVGVVAVARLGAGGAAALDGVGPLGVVEGLGLVGVGGEVAEGVGGAGGRRAFAYTRSRLESAAREKVKVNTVPVHVVTPPTSARVSDQSPARKSKSTPSPFISSRSQSQRCPRSWSHKN